MVANSRKLGGHCVAGVEPEEHRLVRPVSPIGSGALSDDDCAVAGRTPHLLELVSFTHDGGGNDPTQPENVVIDGGRWTSEGMLDPTNAFEILSGISEKGATLFGNRGRAVPEYVAAQGMASSLAIVEPETLEFGHGEPVSTYPGSPRAVFSFADREWNLPITDFVIGPRLLRLPGGVHSWEALSLPKPKQVLLTVSLGAAHEGWHSKLVAAVMPFD